MNIFEAMLEAHRIVKDSGRRAFSDDYRARGIIETALDCYERALLDLLKEEK